MADSKILSGLPAVRHAAAVYCRSIGAQVRAIIEYPEDLWVMAAAGAMWQILQFAFLSVLFSQVPVVADWSYHEMLLLSSFLTLATATTAVGFDGIWSTGTMVVTGDMDYRITRPAPILVQVPTAHIGLQSIGEIPFGLAMFAYGWIGAGLGPALIPAAVLMLACAIVVNAALLTSACAANFWIKGHFSQVAFILSDVQNQAMRMPLGLFPVGVRAVTTFVVPLAFVNFVPVAILTGHASPWWYVGPPLAAAATVAAAIGVYRLGLRAYDSAGH